jgi:peptidoglycan/LPS O-acetylase OafA/YrhL
VATLLNQEDSRRLAELERQLLREDPEFCARMAGGKIARKRVPVSIALAAAVIWVAALILAVAGWWISAAIAALCATVLIVALVVRFGGGRHRTPRRGPQT